MTHFPKRMPFVSFTQSKPLVALLSASFLLKRDAWFCGSIMSGQRSATSRMMPFSIDSVSVGSPQMFQLRITTCLPHVTTTLHSSVCSSCLAVISARHSA